MPEIFIYDEIGPDWMGYVSAASVIKQLKQHEGQAVTIRMNSPGGDVFEGQAIYNALRRHGSPIHVEIDSLAASAASYVAMAGDRITIAENAMVMIHNAWTFTAGDKARHLEVVSLLEKVDGIIMETYAKRLGSKADAVTIQGWMNSETWMTAKEAVERGFADAIGQSLNVAACLKEGRYRNAPAALLRPELKREQERKTRENAIAFQKRLTAARK